MTPRIIILYTAMTIMILAAGVNPVSAGSNGSWKVTWGPDPNGIDVLSSSKWNKLQGDIETGPYQPDTSIEDAERELEQGFENTAETGDGIIDRLEWTKGAGIKISEPAQELLDQLKNPRKAQGATSPPVDSGISKKHQDEIVKWMGYWDTYNQLKQKNDKQGKPTTLSDMKKEINKDKVKNNLNSAAQTTGYNYSADLLSDVFGLF